MSRIPVDLSTARAVYASLTDEQKTALAAAFAMRFIEAVPHSGSDDLQAIADRAFLLACSDIGVSP